MCHYSISGNHPTHHPHTREKLEADLRTLKDRSMSEHSGAGSHSRRTLPANKKHQRDIRQPGLQHLNGIQAVAYARLRYMDNDFERTKRQREVISKCLSIAKKSDLATLTKIIDTVLPQVAFNMDTADIIEASTKEMTEGGIRESETDESEVIEALTKEAVETSKGGTNESVTATVKEPGKLSATDHDGQDGPA